MVKLIDLNTDEDFAMYREVITKIADGNIVATLKQAVPHPDGGYTHMDIEQYVAVQRSLIQINGEFVYVTVRDMETPDCKKIKSMFNVMLQHGTQQFEKGAANDYVLTIEIAHTELHNGYIYILSCVQPVFISGEGDDDLTLVFLIGNVLVGKESVSIYDVEYEMDMREAREDNVHKFDFSDDEELATEDDDNDDDLLISGDGSDFVDTSDYTTGI